MGFNYTTGFNLVFNFNLILNLNFFIKLYYYIDGINHVSKIAFLADVDVTLVKACIQNLIYYGLVSLVPIFLYSNVYVTTPGIRTLIEDSELQKECLKSVYKIGSLNEPSLKKVLQLYSNMCTGMTVKDLCQRFNPHSNGIDEQKLIKFGIMKGIIRRIQKYPILLNDLIEDEPDSWMHSSTITQSNITTRSTSSPQSNTSTSYKNIYLYFDGKHSYDQLCCEFNKTYQEIEEKVEKNRAVVVCWK